MRKNRRTEITVETNEVVVVRRTGGATRAWCPECCDGVWMITPDEAAAITSVSSRTIYRAVEDGRLHNAETADGFLLICPKSLSRNFIVDNHVQPRSLANHSDTGGHNQ